MATNGRLRDYLTRVEVRALLRAAKCGKRYAARNHAMICSRIDTVLGPPSSSSCGSATSISARGDNLLPAKEGVEIERPPMKRDEIRAVERVLGGRETGFHVFAVPEPGGAHFRPGR